MFVMNNVVIAVATVLDSLLTVYFWIVLIAVLLTWVRPDPYNPIVRTLTLLTEPVFYFIRRLLPFTYINGLDLSPVVVMIIIQLLQNIVVRSMFQWASQ